jgi:hypothetical protein
MGKTAPRMKNLSVLIPADTFERLQKLAAEQFVPISIIVREILRERVPTTPKHIRDGRG